MKTKSMILIMIALGCGLVASIGVSQVISNGSSKEKAVEKKYVLVAIDLINPKDPITKKNVKVEKRPVDLIPDEAYSSLEKMTDPEKLLEEMTNPEQLYSRLVVLKDMVLTKKMLGTSADINFIDVPKGMRVLAIKASLDELVESLLQPGDRVDITGFFRINGQEIAKTFLHDVQVFSVNQQTGRETMEGEGNMKNARTVSLVVKPEQVEKLIFAKRSGSLTLSLRNGIETNPTKTNGMTLKQLLGDDSESPNAKRKVVEPEKKVETKIDVVKALDSLKMKTAAFGNIAKTTAKPVKMLVHTADGVKEYTWHDPNGVPEVNDISGGSVALAAPPSFATAPTTGTGDAKQNTNPPTNDSKDKKPIEEDE